MKCGLWVRADRMLLGRAMEIRANGIVLDVFEAALKLINEDVKPLRVLNTRRSLLSAMQSGSANSVVCLT